MSIAVGELERSALTIRELDGREDLDRPGLRPVHGGREHPTFGLRAQKASEVASHGLEVAPIAGVVLVDEDSLHVRPQCLADGRLARWSRRAGNLAESRPEIYPCREIGRASCGKE